MLAAIHSQTLRRPEATALRYLPQARSPSAASAQDFSYREVWSTCCAAARKLHALCAGAKGAWDAAGGAVADDSWELVQGCSGVVVLLLDEGPLLPMLMLSVLLAGMVLVPLEPEEAPARLALMLSELKPSAVVVRDDAARERLLAAAGVGASEVLTVDQVVSPGIAAAEGAVLRVQGAGSPAAESKLPMGDEVQAEQISHVCFTSGSSGRPKGCIVSHGALQAYCEAKIREFRVDVSSRVFLASPPSFDPALGDVVSTWSAGACLVVAPKRMVLGQLYQCLVASQTTHILTTPSLWSSVTPPPQVSGMHALRVIGLGGEVMSTAIIDFWGALPDTRLLNVYGVTECAVYNTAWQVKHSKDSRCIGSSIGKNRLLIVRGEADGEKMEAGQRQGEGGKAPRDGDSELEVLWDSCHPHAASDSESVQGELVIVGRQVGERYLNRPQLSSSKFVGIALGTEVCRCFRTGDWVRTRPGIGGLMLLGRRDTQVKLQGKRVDLGEIEGAILESAQPVIQEVAVVVTEDARITAFVVLPPPPPSSSPCNYMHPPPTGEVEEKDVLQELLDELVFQPCLPRHMRPHSICFLRGEANDECIINGPSSRQPGVGGGFGCGALPVTRTGKLDRRALMEQAACLQPGDLLEGGEEWDEKDEEGEGDGESLNPENEGEAAGIGAMGGGWGKHVLDCWGAHVALPNLEGVKASRAHSLLLARRLDFTKLGGDSLAAMRSCKLLSEAFRAALVLHPCPDAREEVTKGVQKQAGVDEVGVADAGEFGEALAGALAPIELLRNSRFQDYVARLYHSLGPWPGGVQCRVFEPAGPLEGEGGADTSGGERACGVGRAMLYRTAASGGVSGPAILAWLLLRFPSLSLDEIGGGGMTLVHVACKNGQVHLVEELWSRGARFNLASNHGVLPIHFAAQCRRGAAALSLLTFLRDKTNVDVRAVDGNRQTVLHHAARAGVGTKILHLLLDWLHLASSANHKGGGSGKGKNRAKPRNSGGGRGNSFGVMDETDVWGRTALHWASINGHAIEVEALLQLGADVSIRDSASETALDMAERRARCGASERNNGERASTFGGIAKILGGSGSTRNLKAKGYYS